MYNGVASYINMQEEIHSESEFERAKEYIDIGPETKWSIHEQVETNTYVNGGPNQCLLQ